MRTGRLYGAFFAFLLMNGTSSTAWAAEASAGVDFASSYIFRGLTLNDNWVMQPSFEVSPDEIGLTLGTWVNYDMESSSSGSVEGGNVSEVDLIASYDLPLEIDPLSWSIGYTEYTYPHSEAEADREISTVIAFDVPLSPSLGAYFGMDGAIEESVVLELKLGHDFELAEDLSFSLGATGIALWQPKDSEAEDGISCVRADAGITYMFASATVSYFAETDEDVLVVNEDWMVTLGVSFDF